MRSARCRPKPRKIVKRTLVPTTTLKGRAALLDLLPGVIVVTDRARRILFWSKGAEVATGWSAADVIGKDFTELLRISDENGMNEAFGDLAGGGTWDGEFEIVSRGNSQRTFHGWWKCIGEGDEMAGSFLLANSDITNLKRTRMESLCAHLPDNVGPLANGIAHDLNNVFAPILIVADVLEQTCKGPEERHMVEMIRDSAKRGAQIVRQIQQLT